MEGRPRLEVRVVRGLRTLRTGRWLSDIRKHLSLRSPLGISGTDLFLLVAPTIKTEPADLAAVHAMAPVGTILWFDEVGGSLLRQSLKTSPFFKFTLKDTTVDKLGTLGPDGARMAPLLVPRRVDCTLTEQDQNYLIRLHMAPEIPPCPTLEQ